MNRINIKLLGVLAIFLFIAIMPIAIFAANEDVSIVSTINSESKQEYIIYIKDYSNQKFKYAFSTNAIPEKEEYDNSISDLGGNQIALLDVTTYEELTKESSTIFMWAMNEEEELILEKIQLDLTKSVTQENIDNVETLTKRIEVEIADSQQDTTTIRNENVDGVDEVANVGHIKIVDDADATYYYEITKRTDSEEHDLLMTLAEQTLVEQESTEQTYKKYAEMDMYEKVQFAIEFNELFTSLTDAATMSNSWQELTAKDMTIKQDEKSVKGDQYIVLLKKVAKINGEEVTTLDVQFLTADDNYEPNVVIEEVVTQETTRLPITYDSIALFIVLGIIVILVIAVFIRMKKLNKQDEEK